MNYYLAMTTVGLFAKIWASYRLQRNWDQSPEVAACFVFLGLAYAQTVVELYGYYGLYNIQQYSDFNKTLILRLYYVSFVVIISAIPILILTLTRNMRIPLTFIGINILAPGMLAYFILTTNQIIAGIKPLEYMFTRVPGEYYWIFQAYCFSIVAYTILVALHSSRHAVEANKIKGVNLLVGYIPVAALIVIILPIMQIGFKTTAAGSFPLFVAFFIIVMSENIKTANVLDLRIYLPWTEKAKTIRNISRPFKYVDLQPCDSRQLAKEYEQALVAYAVDILQDRRDAAEILNISQAKISKLIGKRRSGQNLQES